MLINKVKKVKITDKITIGNDKIFLIAGPCVIESEDLVMEVAGKMKEITEFSIFLRLHLIKQIALLFHPLGDLDLKKGWKFYQELRKNTVWLLRQTFMNLGNAKKLQK